MENLGNMVKFLDIGDLPKLNQVNIYKLNRSIMSNEIKEIMFSQ
jgi:hypothetical protein